MTHDWVLDKLTRIKSKGRHEVAAGASEQEEASYDEKSGFGSCTSTASTTKSHQGKFRVEIPDSLSIMELASSPEEVVGSETLAVVLASVSQPTTCIFSLPRVA